MPTTPGARRRGRAARLLAAAAAVALAGLAVAAAPPRAASAADVPTGTLSVFKRVENLDTGSGFSDRTAWTMHAENVDTGETFEGDGLNGFQTKTVPEGTYRLSETGFVAGYRFNNWTCSDGSPTTEQRPLVYVGEGASITCTVENVAIKPSLTLRKEVTGGDADPTLWQLHAHGPDSLDGATGSDAVTGVPVRIGSYTLSEDGGPDGYAASAWACDVLDVGGDSRRETVPQGGSLDIVLGDRIVCTVVNSTQGPHLTLRKVVDNAGGGTAAATDWTLAATAVSGGTTISGASGSPSVTDAGVPAGRYDLAESGGPPGYAAGDWVCDGGTGANGSAVTLAADDDVTCTVTNTWTPAHLTLVKSVVQFPGGAATPADWLLSARDDGGAGFSGTSGDASATDVPVAGGTYTLGEDGPDGYTAGAWQCDGGDVTTVDGQQRVAVAAGDDVTCTVVNTLDLPQPAQLTLVKDVDGGPDVPSDWALTATRVVGAGLPAFSGLAGGVKVRHVAVLPGTFELSEAPADGAPGTVDGYAAGDWTCDGGDVTTVDGNQRVTLAAGDVVACTVTNTWQGGSLTLVKHVDNAWGGDATPADWTLDATLAGATEPTLRGRTGTDTVTRVDVVAGTYDLAESAGPAGYASEGWSCTSGGAGSTVTVGAGDDVTCTVTNADEPAHLTLVKRMDPLRSDDAAASDFTLTAVNGTTTVTGHTGEDAVTRVAVPAGSYTLTESGPDGFRAVWACLGARSQRGLGEAAGAPAGVDVGLGQDVRCTVVNAVPGPFPTPTPTPTPTSPTPTPTSTPSTSTGTGTSTTTPSGTAPSTGGSDSGAGGLATTGAPVAFVGGLGAVLLLAGAAALVVRRFWLRG